MRRTNPAESETRARPAPSFASRVARRRRARGLEGSLAPCYEFPPAVWASWWDRTWIATDVSGSSESDTSGSGGFTRSVAERRIGSRLGARWTLDKVLGIGGSACVYAAHHSNGRHAAVKV